MMMYDLLKLYKVFLMERYSRETSATYAKRLALLFKGQCVKDPVGNMDTDKILERLEQIKYKNHFSQAKNAFLHFCEFQGVNLPHDIKGRIRELEQKTIKKRRKLKGVEYRTVAKRIQYLRNKRLKLSYQVMIATGLRVSELASITLDDCMIDEAGITFCFIGKGGNDEALTLSSLDNARLCEQLKKHINILSSSSVFDKNDKNDKDDKNDENDKTFDKNDKNKKVFYSAVYLQTKARELGFKCHDLRRIFAKLEYKKCGSKEVVMKKLRHTNLKTTNIYLRSKVFL